MFLIMEWYLMGELELIPWRLFTEVVSGPCLDIWHLESILVSLGHLVGL